MCFLEVSLSEEFDEKQIRPKSAEVERLSWVGDICHVEHELDEAFLLFAVRWIVVIIILDLTL